MIQGILRGWILGFSIFFKLWGPGNARKSQNKHASCGLNSKALSLGGNMETMGKLEYSQNTRHSAWYLVTVDAFCQRWPPWQQKHSRANCVQRDFPSMAIPMSSTLAVSLHEHFSIMGWKMLKGSLLRQVCSKAFRGSVSAQLDIIKVEPHT